ncbi:ABC transporter permease [Propylenella binzhouense]|uniref:ABC transporter permease n=1 Tax=Propylenella binzhouense TaxID=2555902 RepID=A0A964T425_9HYPH|nr:ABC transporter permease [Propylenella binzhouense]MYZ47534.1 ABC transporter permease [Propylenella binzhouense]
MREARPASFYALALFFGLFVLFLYGPMITILVLSFQGPQGGLTFPLNGLSLHWFGSLWNGIGVIDIGAALRRSLWLGVVVMLLTVVISVMAGLAFRRRFRGAALLFYVAIASLIMPSIVVSLGIALEFRILDDSIKALGDAWEIEAVQRGYTTAMGLFTSGLGAHLSWTLPFGLLIMFAVFNRFDRRYEEAARDLGATPWQSFRHVVLPIVAPSLIGIALFGFTLSWDEVARSSQALGSRNTLPLELRGLTTTVTTPVIYALGTVTTGISMTVIGICLALAMMVQRRRRRQGTDAGRGML